MLFQKHLNKQTIFTEDKKKSHDVIQNTIVCLFSFLFQQHLKENRFADSSVIFPDALFEINFLETNVSGLKTLFITS